MTADDIMAREAGMPIDDEHFVFQATRERVTKFAALVRAAALEEAAGVCDDKHDEWRFGDGEDAASGPKDCAAAIRQLKDKP